MINVRLLGFFFTCIAVLLAGRAYTAERPNIVMIAVDDLNDWVGVYGGHSQSLTPHLDSFAEKAMVFRNASCPAPVCGPSRSALLSGFMPATTGLYGNANNMLDSEMVQTHATLPEYFSKHGYTTISMGKIFHRHFTKNGVDRGHWAFDEWESGSGEHKVDPERFNSRTKGIVRGEKLENPKFTEKGGSDFAFGPLLTKKEDTRDYRTAKWFEERLQEDHDKPFFMAVGFSKPHLPFCVPEEYFDRFDLDSIRVAEIREDDLEDILDEKGRKAFDPHPDYLWCQEYDLMREATLAYLASVAYADECIGVVLDALAKSQYAENTIVVIWGDHGWHLGEKLKFRKASLWREATQLPFLVKVPGMQGGQVSPRNVNLIDIYPTLIELCGLPGKELDGRSIVPLLQDPELEWKPAITTYQRGNHSVISEKWHYITRGQRNVEELYDLENDPFEWENLIHTQPELAEPVVSLLREYLPGQDAEMVVGPAKDRSNKKLDQTIKVKRNLKNLK